MTHFVSESCAGEHCGPCSRAGKTVPATHKLGEEIPHNAPFPAHNLSQYVCCSHFGMIVGPRSADIYRGCIAGVPDDRP